MSYLYEILRAATANDHKWLEAAELSFLSPGGRN